MSEFSELAKRCLEENAVSALELKVQTDFVIALGEQLKDATNPMVVDVYRKASQQVLRNLDGQDRRKARRRSRVKKFLWLGLFIALSSASIAATFIKGLIQW